MYPNALRMDECIILFLWCSGLLHPFFRKFLGTKLGRKKLNNLEKYGLIKENNQTNQNLGRVIAQHRDLYQVVTNEGVLEAKVSGKLRYQLESPIEFPAVGDWVELETKIDIGVIQKVLPRKSVLVRESSGSSSQGQVIASNIETIFICMSLNHNFNPRRVERFLTIVWDSGATPVVVLTKSDQCDDVEEKLQALEDVCFGIKVVVCSIVDGTGLAELQTLLQPQQTLAFVGSSGVGKSSLINHFLGQDLLETKQIRGSDDKGRHTTTSREMLILPNGGIVIDTPGMRELQILTGDVSKTFEDITELAKDCKFRDCTHQNEPGCAVKKAIDEGFLDADRLASYLKLQREVLYSQLNSRQLENQKINQFFGSKKAMKQSRKHMQQIKRR